MASTLKLHRQGAVGFIDWLDLLVARKHTDEHSIARLRRTRHGGVMPGRTIDILDGYAKDPIRFARVKAPLMKGCSSGVIKYAMTSALYRVHAVDGSIRANLQRKNTAAREVSCLSFCRILRRWSEGGILLRVRKDRQQQQRDCGAKRATLHRSNETKLSRGYVGARLRCSECSLITFG